LDFGLVGGIIKKKIINKIWKQVIRLKKL